MEDKIRLIHIIFEDIFIAVVVITAEKTYKKHYPTLTSLVSLADDIEYEEYRSWNSICPTPVFL
jgi:hypothetical protein